MPVYPICALLLHNPVAGTELSFATGETYVLTDPGDPGVVGDEQWTHDGAPVTGCATAPVFSPAWTTGLEIRTPEATWALDAHDLRQLWRRGAWPRRSPVVFASPTRCL